MDEMANKNEPINNVIQLLPRGFLGKGAFGISYKCKLKGNPSIEYAIKVTYPMYVGEAQNEFEMYTYLDAINKSETEAFGVPVIYYYDTWWWKKRENFTMMAMTLLDSEFGESMKNKKFGELDVMIMFREFVSSIYILHTATNLKKKLHP